MPQQYRPNKKIPAFVPPTPDPDNESVSLSYRPFTNYVFFNSDTQRDKRLNSVDGKTEPVIHSDAPLPNITPELLESIGHYDVNAPRHITIKVKNRAKPLAVVPQVAPTYPPGWEPPSITQLQSKQYRQPRMESRGAIPAA